MIWLLVGMLLGGAYGFLWALMVTGSDADDRTVSKWEREQAEWWGDDQ